MVIAPSASHASALTACYGEVSGLQVVHNAVRPAVTSNMRRNIVVAAGRWWDAGKNGAVLDAAAQHISWPIFCAGATTSPNGDGMLFHNAMSLGSLSYEESLRLMAEASVFVSPSLYEPFGLAALEAAKAGTPLVLADIPTYRELWTDAALFFPPGDAMALANAINRLSANPCTRKELGDAAIRRSRLYTVAKQASAMRSVYDQAAAIHAGSH
jgi:glycosyltransferase involved in cell wall biosynthesis